MQQHTERLSDVDEISLVELFEKLDCTNLSALPKKFDQPILLRNMTKGHYRTFLTWLTSRDLHIRTELDEGDILITELPTGRHDALHGVVSNMVYHHSLPNIFPTLVNKGSGFIPMQGDNDKCGDCSYIVRDRPDMSCPNLVIETANTQSLQSLYNKVRSYFVRCECIQAVLCFKLYEDCTMVAFLFLKPFLHPVRIVSFGRTMLSGEEIQQIRNVMNLNDTADMDLFSGYIHPFAQQCLHPGIPEYLITIPREYILSHNADRSILSDLGGGDLVVDLYLVRVETLLLWDV